MVLVPEEVGEKGCLESRSPTLRLDGLERTSARTGFEGPDWRQTERAIAIWIEEQVQRRIPVSGYLIQEKALDEQSEPSTSTSQARKEFLASKE
ncbi:hypothetical protein TNCV_4493131 [Trichonephila clavipes]|uniref:HTH CENPB-type domain-containing protein n=1 Tax=Trichonephila clavipes TaxID=2585209 RepID=A0A8X6SPE2_TRICX|nr:hypothetical protein TNCV_4493131 [Trichonephila clavipes]